VPDDQQFDIRFFFKGIVADIAIVTGKNKKIPLS